MSKILDQLPYPDVLDAVVVQGERIPILAHQIIVWVSVSRRDVVDLEADAPRFPAILDTGNTFRFSLAEDHVIRWCGLRLFHLDVLGPVLINRQRLNRYAADVWIHRNRRKQRDAFRAQPPFRLELRDGIAVYPADAGILAPRLPSLGIRAIDENGLRCTINGRRRTVSRSSVGPA
jgi:hypothetical protein